MTTRAVFSDVCAIYRERLLGEPETISSDVRERMLTGLSITGVEYAEAMAFKSIWKHVLGDLFTNVELLLSPTAPVGAPPIDDGSTLLQATRAMTRNTYAGAFGHLPGLSVPCGFTSSGLPIGVQLEAAWWAEPLLFRAGCAHQTRTRFHLTRPALTQSL